MAGFCFWRITWLLEIAWNTNQKIRFSVFLTCEKNTFSLWDKYCIEATPWCIMGKVQDLLRPYWDLGSKSRTYFMLKHQYSLRAFQWHYQSDLASAFLRPPYHQESFLRRVRLTAEKKRTLKGSSHISLIKLWQNKCQNPIAARAK